MQDLVKLTVGPRSTPAHSRLLGIPWIRWYKKQDLGQILAPSDSSSWLLALVWMSSPSWLSCQVSAVLRSQNHRITRWSLSFWKTMLQNYLKSDCQVPSNPFPSPIQVNSKARTSTSAGKIASERRPCQASACPAVCITHIFRGKM